MHLSWHEVMCFAQHRQMTPIIVSILECCVMSYVMWCASKVCPLLTQALSLDLLQCPLGYLQITLTNVNLFKQVKHCLQLTKK